MIAALMRPEMGTVTNQAMKMFLNKRQSTAFRERIQPTATTEPTWQQKQGNYTTAIYGVLSYTIDDPSQMHWS